MKTKYKIVVLLVLLLSIGIIVSMGSMLFAQPPDRPSAPINQARAKAALRKLPLSFEPNQGQTDAQVEFLGRGSGYTVFLTSSEAMLVFAQAREESRPIVLRLQFVDASANPEITGLDKLPGKSNYFLGQDPMDWHTNIPTYAKVKYDNLYPDIDLIYYGNKNELEYDFVVHPGGDPITITLRFEGIDSLELDPKGDLLINTFSGVLQQEKPYAYQKLEGRKQTIATNYLLKGPNEVGFEIAEYDTS